MLAAAGRHARPDEHAVAVMATEPASGTRIYVVAFAAGERPRLRRPRRRRCDGVRSAAREGRGHAGGAGRAGRGGLGRDRGGGAGRAVRRRGGRAAAGRRPGAAVAAQAVVGAAERLARHRLRTRARRRRSSSTGWPPRRRSWRAALDAFDPDAERLPEADRGRGPRFPPPRARSRRRRSRPPPVRAIRPTSRRP